MLISVINMLKGKSGGSAAVIAKSLKLVSTMLPNLIGFTETTNTGATGAEKKQFLMDMVKNLFIISGTALDDETLENLSIQVDEIVALTKRMHTNGEVNTANGNSQHDIGTVTGLGN